MSRLIQIFCDRQFLNYLTPSNYVLISNILFTFKIKDSRGSVHRSSGPAGTFPTSAEQQQHQLQEHQKQQQPQQHHQQESAALLNSYTIPKDLQPFEFIESDGRHGSPFGDSNAAGSLFSIHSAPPVPLADLSACIQSSISGGAIDVNDSPRRPVSLAIDSQYFSTKTIAVFQHQGSELEEEDNENLLTVSSLTARPLIAKSRELRTTK